MELFHTHVSPEAIKHATDVLSSGHLSEGGMVKRFEQALADEFGLANPVAVNSGTSALHLGLILAGVGPGDEVILPAQTFVATGMAVLHCGAKPVFADIDPRTGNICPKDVARRINGWTQAIVPVHWAGLPCDYMGTMAFMSNVRIVADAAHALGATLHGKPVSDSAHFTMFSFQATKHLTTGDGGCLCCIDKEAADRARKLRWFGIDRALEPGPLGERDFDINEAGFKYHMNDLAAAVGLGNLVGFKERLAKRQYNHQGIQFALMDMDGIEFLKTFDDRTSACYCFSMLVERRDDFVKAMKARGAPCSVVCSRIDDNKVFGGRRDDLPGTDYFDSRHIAVPCHEALRDAALSLIVDSIRKGW